MNVLTDREREDTTRCIISKLFDDENHSLADELKKTEPISLLDDDDDEECDLNWAPLSRDMGKGRIRGYSRFTCFFSLLKK